MLITQDRLVYGAQFSDAMALLFGQGGTIPAKTMATPVTASAPVSAAQTDPQLSDRANRAFDEYCKFTSERKLGEAGATGRTETAA